MLNAYLIQFANLIQAPSSTIPLVSTAQATVYINTARGQVAGEGECIRVYATLPINAPTQQYSFAAISFPLATAGVQGVLNVRQAAYQVASGQRRIVPREFEWFFLHVLNNPVPAAGPPKYWAQFGQGASGTVFFNLPDQPYTMVLDTVCYPLPLALDTDPEAIPYLWTDAVPYYAAWLGLMSLQRQADADMMMRRFQDLMARARRAATPAALPGQYSQGPDPMAPNRLGMQTAGGQAA